ncbi:MAG: helix-hairpin-helix domain-containing protein [Lachnospiraceae bacterium]|nr:helix-hairpin-helix domain-containing protein [Lachnospiraceae bacterium]
MKKLLIIIIVSLSLFLISCNSNGLVLSEIPESFPEETIQLNTNENGAGPAPSFDEKKEAAGCVYICGAVENAGIYEFKEGARLYELIKEAGGLDEEADADAINLAMEVKDGEQIRIPYIGETLSMTEEKLVDINKADLNELCSIPGIGEARATAIIEYRESCGGFKEIEELKNISGIKDATFNKIKPYVCVR